MHSQGVKIPFLAGWILILTELGGSAWAQAVPEVRPVLPGEDAKNYHLVWSDEFDGTSVDTQKWNFRTDSKAQSTQEPGNASVANGMLTLALKQQSAQGKAYTGGGLISRRTFEFGYYEARLRVPAEAGWHTSFWTQKYDGVGTNPKLSAQELDVIENNSAKLHGYAATVHRWAPPSRTLGSKWCPTPDLFQAFHVYGGEFTPERVRFFFDGTLVLSVDVSKEPHSEQNIWLTSIAYFNVKKGAKAVAPAAAEFDYVRFFEAK